MLKWLGTHGNRLVCNIETSRDLFLNVKSATAKHAINFAHTTDALVSMTRSGLRRKYGH
jgi:hypothetical protein